MTDNLVSETPAREEKIIPLTGMKGMIAKKMVESLTTTAQLTHNTSCDVTALLQKKEELANNGTKVSFEDLIVDAVIEAIKLHPGINGYADDKQIEVKPFMHIAVAVALEGDLLMAPAILNANQLPIADRAIARKDVIARAKTNKLNVTEMTKGTFTISNLGLSRVQHFTPIVNKPQIAILGLGEVRKQYWECENGELEVRPIMGLSLSFDHRAINGGPAADFLTDLCKIIENNT
ncbi:hypothetical protein NBRC116602_03530 [Hyphomicrobiales bacterium 4NK60-0047b]